MALVGYYLNSPAGQIAGLSGNDAQSFEVWRRQLLGMAMSEGTGGRKIKVKSEQNREREK